MYLTAFDQSGPGIKIVAAVAAPVGLQAVSEGQGIKTNQYRVQNNGTATVWYAFSDVSAAAAQSNAVAPSGASDTAKRGIPLGAGAIEIISAPPNAWFSASIVAATADVYVTPGRGV